MTTNPKKRSWYDQGFEDAMDGFCDAPMNPGHRDHENYMAGNRDGERQLELNAAREADLDDEPGETIRASELHTYGPAGFPS